MKNVLLLVLSLSLSSLTFAQWDAFKNLDFSLHAKDSITGKAYWQTKDFVQFANDENSNECKFNSKLKITGSYTKDKHALVYQQHSIAVDEFVKLRVSARLKGEIEEEGYAGIFCFTKNGEQWLKFANLKEGPIEGSTEWKKVSTEIWVSPLAKTLRIGATMVGAGTLWIDDFEVETIERNDCEFNTAYLPFMQECMDTIAIYSLYKDDIDIPKLMEHWKQLSACAESLNDVQKVFGSVLKLIDNHSFIMSAKDVNSWESPSSSDKKVEMPLSKGHLIDEHYAYIWMPHFSSGDQATGIMFADHLQTLIDSLDHEDLKGWVFDLRNNGGGNCWPMLAGIGPILGEGTCGFFQFGEQFSDWSYQAGASCSNGNPITQSSKNYIPHLKNPPVAVLTGSDTGSSGEVVTAAFKNRDNSRSFGQHTAKYSTGNANYTLSDGSMLFIASSVYTDRDKNPYLHGIPPDVTVEEVEGEDKPMEEALEWLKSLEK